MPVQGASERARLLHSIARNTRLMTGKVMVGRAEKAEGAVVAIKEACMNAVNFLVRGSE